MKRPENIGVWRYVHKAAERARIATSVSLRGTPLEERWLTETIIVPKYASVALRRLLWQMKVRPREDCGIGCVQADGECGTSV